MYTNNNNSIRTKIEISVCITISFFAQVSHGGKGTFI